MQFQTIPFKGSTAALNFVALQGVLVALGPDATIPSNTTFVVSAGKESVLVDPTDPKDEKTALFLWYVLGASRRTITLDPHQRLQMMHYFTSGLIDDARRCPATSRKALRLLLIHPDATIGVLN